MLFPKINITIILQNAKTGRFAYKNRQNLQRNFVKTKMLVKSKLKKIFTVLKVENLQYNKIKLTY